MVDRDETKSNESDDFLDELNELFDDALDDNADPATSTPLTTDAEFVDIAADATETDELHDAESDLRDNLDWTDETEFGLSESSEIEREAEFEDAERVPDEPDQWRIALSADDGGTVPLEDMLDESDNDQTTGDLDAQQAKAGTPLEDDSWSELELATEMPNLGNDTEGIPWPPADELKWDATGDTEGLEQPELSAADSATTSRSDAMIGPDDLDEFEPLDGLDDLSPELSLVDDQTDGFSRADEEAPTVGAPPAADHADFEVLEAELLEDPMGQPLSYAARVAAASYPGLGLEEIAAENSPSEVDPEGRGAEPADSALNQPAAEAGDDVPENIDTDLETDLLDGDWELNTTPSDALEGAKEFAEVGLEAPADIERARMPLDVRQSTEAGAVTLAPPVPVKRSLFMEFVKVVLALVMLAFTLQMGLWWGLGSDPVGFAHVVPAWLLPNQLKLQVAELPTRSTPPSPPADNPVDREPAPQASNANEAVPPAAPNTDTEPTAPASSDLNDEPMPEIPPANDQLDEKEVDSSFASNSLPAGEGLNSGLTDFKADQPSDAGTKPGLELAVPDSESVTAIEPDTLLNELDVEASSADDPSGFDAMLDSPGADLEAAPQLTADETSDQTKSDAVELDQSSAQPPATELRPLGAPTFSPDELASAIVAAREADSSLTSARINHDPDLVRKAEQFYRSFAALAVTATYVDRHDAEEVLKSARDLLSSFEFDEKKQRMIANATRNWIKADLGDGVIAAVTVADLSRKGELFEVKASLMGKEAIPMTLLTPNDPGLGGQSGFKVGDRILVLGVIVDQPERKIDGYLGAAATVIWFTDLAVAIP